MDIQKHMLKINRQCHMVKKNKKTKTQTVAQKTQHKKLKTDPLEHRLKLGSI